jgi:hypothetical protein
MNVVAQVRLSTKKISARPAMARRSSKRRKSWRLKSTKALPTITNTLSMARLTSIQVLSQVTLSFRPKSSPIRSSSEKEPIC